MRIIKILILTLSSFSIIAQNISGIAVYKYKFNLGVATKDTLIGRLYFDNQGESYYISKNGRKAILTNISNDNQIKDKEIKPLIIKKDSSIVYRNIINKEYFYSKSSHVNTLILSDSLKDIKWNLLSENKKIGKFSCTLAKAKFAGRNYSVWFTTEIPVSAGPWKLYGLPGLIMEVYDDLGLIYYVLDSIEIKNGISIKPFSIDILRERAIKKTEFNRKEKLEEDKMRGYVQSQGSQIEFKKGQGMELEEN